MNYSLANPRLERGDALKEILADLASDKSVGALVITGAGDANFSVGMNLKQLPEGVKRKGSLSIGGPEALRIGLVNEVWPNDELQQCAQDLAQELAAMPAIAVAGVLRCVVDAGRDALTDGLVAERKAVLAIMGTKDQQEGMRAFLEKHKPMFAGE